MVPVCVCVYARDENKEQYGINLDSQRLINHRDKLWV